LYDAQDYSAALRVFYQAWLLIPKPQTDYAEAGWVLTAIGDSYYRLEQFEPGTEALHSALCCPLADKSPFVHLRLGQCLYGLQRLAEARQCLFRAYQGGGSSLLTAEPARYRELIADLLPRD
jgi:tetratricopeptide (TPR) repeat protein